MESTAPPEASEPCPACGGGGGGPFGRAGSAWDDEGYVCVLCEGAGVVRAGAPVSVPRPGLAKPVAPAPAAAPAKKKKRAAG